MGCYRSTRVSHRGFTLVELLVVIAIIGVLIGLLLPAVQAARESARRMRCNNNLKQIGVALHSYASSHSTFPAAYGWNTQSKSKSWQKAWGWGARILPFLEESALSDVLGVESREFNEAMPGNNSSSWPSAIVAAMRTSISGFRCPSDVPPSDINTSTDFCHSGGPDSTKPALSNYAGVYGYQFSNWGPSANGEPAHFGVMRGQNGVGIEEIFDGTSNTFAVGERGWSHGAAYWVGVGNVNSEAQWSSPKVVGRVFIWKINAPRVGRYYSAFSSMHPGGANFAMADGSVHFINETPIDGISLKEARKLLDTVKDRLDLVITAAAAAGGGNKSENLPKSNVV
ncbi:MAG: DUF1559 domain-containing protein, partial [Pirellulales bacterium]